MIFTPGETYSSEESTRRRSFLKELQGNESLKKPLARVKVMAKDTDAADTLALRRVREIVDVLNCLAPLTSGRFGRVYLAGEAETVISSSLMTRDGKLLRTSSSLKGPFGLLSCRELRSSSDLGPVLGRVHRLLKERAELDELVLTSMSWAGRASLEPIREHAFLQHAIALETLLVAEEARDIKFRLRSRLVRLLGASATRRRWLHDYANEMYQKRSDIVHDGCTDVSQDELAALDSLTRQCILRALMHRSIRRMTTVPEYTRWLDTH
jgi:hypothetical protein